MGNLLQKPLEIIYNKFKHDPAKMLIGAGVAGWALSSAAQICGIVLNDKISPKEKTFLIPQEVYDAFWNIGLYFILTLSTKKLTSKLFSTGKFAPNKIRAFLKENKLNDRVGKLDFNLDDVLKNKPELLGEYRACKSFGTTVATVGAGIISSNILTPVMRNNMASNLQKKCLEYDDSLQQNKLNTLAYNNAGNLKI